jgi:hypothetical protein
MKTIIGLVLAATVCSSAWAESTPEYIRQNAVQITKNIFPSSVLAAVSGQKVLFVGEMHGTNESPELTLGLVQLLSSARPSVLIGLEIPTDAQPEIDRFLQSGDEAILKQLPFFTNSIQDGRRSRAMAHLLSQLRIIHNVTVVCIDPQSQVAGPAPTDRDLEMAKNLRLAMGRFKPDVTVTLTGNCHSKLTTQSACNPSMNPMAYDLLTLSPDLNVKNTLSLDIRYESASAWVSMNDFEGVHWFQDAPTIYSEALSWNSYFLIEPTMTTTGYNAALFVRKLSYSLPLDSAYPDQSVPLFAQVCCIPQSELQQLMGSSYRDFDQNLPDGGWRKYQRLGCYEAAFNLLNQYQASHSSELTPAQVRILSWHAGQVAGFENDYFDARKNFVSSFDLNEPANATLFWNDYVFASIAFLDHDVETLKAHRDRIAREPLTNGKQPNLNVVDNLTRYFNMPYGVAYSSGNQPQPALACGN